MAVAVVHRADKRPSSLRLPRATAVLAAHSGKFELAAAGALYGAYELVRGLGSASLSTARAHSDDVVSLERHAGVFVERPVQSAVDHLPVLPSVLGAAYMTLHFIVTGAFLVWVHRSHRERFGLVRTTLVVATAISLAIYVLYPVAPPRLAGLGFADTVTRNAHVNLSSDALGSLYNPFAAVPSLHLGYALLVGVTVGVLARRRWVRVAGAAYPAFMLFTIVATGNHFFVDAAAGAVVVIVGYTFARALAPAEAPAAASHSIRDSRDVIPSLRAAAPASSSSRRAAA
jgi:hypothetical protein